MAGAEQPLNGHDRPAQAAARPIHVATPSPDQSEHRARLRLRSIGWALLGAGAAGAIGLLLSGPAPALEPALRAGGCGFFYGLLAFHLQRVDPGDSHLQAGLVGAVCAFRSLADPLDWARSPSQVMMGAVHEWLPHWLPLIGSALLLHAAQRQLPALRP
ncbi:MAG: hypothetical protein ACKO7Z_00980 [Cyanobacteriota bacterium]